MPYRNPTTETVASSRERARRLARLLAEDSDRWSFDSRQSRLRVAIEEPDSFLVFQLCHLATRWAPERGSRPLIAFTPGTFSLSFGDPTDPLDMTDIHFAQVAESILRGEGVNP